MLSIQESRGHEAIGEVIDLCDPDRRCILERHALAGAP